MEVATTVIQRTQRARLAQKALTEPRIAESLFQQNLDSLRALQDLVFGLIDRAKATLAQQRAQPIHAARHLAGQRSLL